MNHTTIAILLPTRGRTNALDKSINSVIETAGDPDRVEFLLAFDRDDKVGLDHFNNTLKETLIEKNINFKALMFDRMGYININKYYNALAKHTNADWLFVWNDDAFMVTPEWDRIIDQYRGQFKILKVHTHNEHPYSIFPIVPAKWVDLLGHMSGHQMIDAWISQIAYMIDIIEIVDIDVTHDRHDLTGNNADATFSNRVWLEGNPSNPGDFHNPAVNNRRLVDCEKIANYLNSQGVSTEWWQAVKTGKQDPWEKLKINDINGQMVQFNLDRNT